MLLLGECAEGIGSSEYARQLLAYAGHAEFLEKIRNARVEIDQWQHEKMALTGLDHELLFYTPGAPMDALGSLRANAYGTLDEAIAALTGRLPKGARIALVPEGPYSFARPAPAYA
jgi:hypothetical protein